MAKWDGIPATLQRWRVDPFTGTPQFLTKTVYETEDLEGLAHTVGADPFSWGTTQYIIMAQEAIYNDGAITLQYDSGGGWTDAVEVNFEPDTAGKYEVDYKFLTGFIRFHSSMDGYSIRLKYTGMGHVVNQEVLYNLFVQDNQYGHEWMAWDQEVHPTKTLPAATSPPDYTWNWFNWYSFIVNPLNGLYAHWPPMKMENDDATSVDESDVWGYLTAPPVSLGPILWGGCSESPAIGYTYVGGVLLEKSRWGPNWLKDTYVDLQVDIHE